MEGEGIVAAVDSPHSPAIVAVESAGDEDPAVESPPSGEEDHRPPPAAAAAAASSEEEVKAKIIKQVEYYFSDENLPNDKFMMKHVKKDKEGFVSISLIASFRKMKKLTKDVSFIVDALRESSQLAVSSDGKKVKRLHPLQISETKDPKSCTVVVENLPEDHSLRNIQQIFGKVGSIKSISVHDPHTAEDAVQSNKGEKLLSGKIYALIEYETVEVAEKAVATLNDETNWRTGLRVQLFRKRMGYNLGRKAGRGPDSEKGSHARVPVSIGDEDKSHSNEKHGDVPDDEDGKHISRERNVRKGRGNNRSKGRKYCGNNGMGHGSVSNVVEASKPPPGPRMPDGTRGFTVGRGRPPISGNV